MSSVCLLFHSPQRNSVSDQGDMEGCAHMLLGNNSFSLPTQPADSQQDSIAAMRATIRPHIQSVSCLAQQLWPWKQTFSNTLGKKKAWKLEFGQLCLCFYCVHCILYCWKASLCIFTMMSNLYGSCIYEMSSIADYMGSFQVKFVTFLPMLKCILLLCWLLFWAPVCMGLAALHPTQVTF